MNIAPINLFTYNTKNPQSADYKSAKLISHIKEPICDTVSFGTANRASKLTKTVYQYIENSEFTKAYNHLVTKGFSSFNPNYYKTSADSNKRSMIGLLIDKYDAKMSPAKMLGYVSLFCTICRLSDFLLNNENADGDLFLKAIEKPLPPLMIETMYYSEAIGDIAPWEKYPIYSKAIEKATESMSDEGNIERYLTISQHMDAEFADYQDAANEYNTESTNTGQTTPKTVYSEAAYRDKDEDEEISIDKFKVIFGPYDPKSLDDVGGFDDIKADIREFIINPWSEEFKARIEQNNIKLPTGILFNGPPGCGKTYMAMAVAAETGYDMYKVSSGNIGDKYQYMTSKKIETLFSKLGEKYRATGKPSIVMLDEMESLASSRENQSTEWKNDDVNTLLTALNNASQNGIIVIGATNFFKALDNAATRSGRVDYVINFRLPNESDRKAIIEKILMGREVAVDMFNNSNELAKITDEMTPADISSVLNIMCLKPIYKHQEQATMQDYYAALEIHNRKKNIGKATPVGFKNERDHACGIG